MKPPLMKLWTADFMKPTSFRVSLQYNIIRYKKGQINWFDRITDNLYLGAIPLKKSSTTGSQGHLGDVPKKLSELNIKAVISCNEEFERVVTPSVAEWEQLGIHQYRVRISQPTVPLNRFR
jgi:atypical dual specificity phosphatase